MKASDSEQQGSPNGTRKEKNKKEEEKATKFTRRNERTLGKRGRGEQMEDKKPGGERLKLKNKL